MKTLIPIIMMLVMLTIIATASIYMSRRMAFYFSIDNVKILSIVFIALSVFMIGGLIAFTNSSHPIGSLLYGAAAVTIGVLLYLLLTVIVLDLAFLVIKVPPLTHGILALSLTALISVYGIWNASHIRISQQEIPIQGLKKNTKAVHLTDIHLGHFRGEKWMQNIVDKTNAQSPDLVFITGDLFDGRINLNPEVLAPLIQIKAPIYFVEGNHDNYTGVQEIKNLLRSMGVQVLENKLVEFEGIQIIGLDHMRPDNQSFAMHTNGHGPSIQSVLSALPIQESQPSIVLHHSPDGVKYASENHIDLFLAGHTHAGQLFPITIFAHYLFAFNRGLHQFENTQVFVSEGIGTFGPPMRVGTKSEIVVLNLVPKV